MAQHLKQVSFTKKMFMQKCEQDTPAYRSLDVLFHCHEFAAATIQKITAEI